MNDLEGMNALVTGGSRGLGRALGQALARAGARVVLVAREEGSLAEAVAELRAPDQSRFRAVVVSYKASEDYRALAEVTKRNWGPWLDRIGEHFGEPRIA